MEPSAIKRHRTYMGKSGLKRRVTRFRICGVDGSGLFGDIFYIPIDRNGKEKKEKSCYSGNFAKWAVREVTTESSEK